MGKPKSRLNLHKSTNLAGKKVFIIMVPEVVFFARFAAGKVALPHGDVAK
jgi:hypothetical protein